MSVLHQLVRHFGALFRKERLDRDMAEEMRFHLAHRTADHIGEGLSPEEARYAALRKFGGTEQIKEQCREARSRSFLWLEHLVQDVRYALRQLANSPAFTLVIVLTLALGIGANTALFSVINGVLLRPLPFPDSDRLVTLWESDPARGLDQTKVSPLLVADWQAQSRAFDGIASWTPPTEVNLVTREGTERICAAYISENLFRLLRVRPQLGRSFSPEHDLPNAEPVAVISDRVWRERYASDPDVLGQTLTIDTFGKRGYTIIGIMPPDFHFPEETELWLPAGWNGLPREQPRRDGHWLNTLARLVTGATLDSARTEMNAIQTQVARANPNVQHGSAVSVVPLLDQTVGARLRTALWVLWAAVAGVLLIACANVANLSLVRAARRRKEIALRLALGASRGRVVRQLLTESLLLSLLGSGVGVLLAVWSVRLLVAISPADIPRLAAVSIDGSALAFTLVLGFGAGMLFGLTPAVAAARADVNDTLKEGGGGASNGLLGPTRRALVVLEVALATVLLVAAALMLQSFAKLLVADRGFRAEHLLTAELDYSVSGFGTWVEATNARPQVSLQEILERVRGLPGVESAGAAYGFPVLRRENQPPTNALTIFGRASGPDDALPTAFTTAVSPGWFTALGARILGGRDFTEADTLDAPGVALINETFARRYFRDENPIGRYIGPGRLDVPLGAVDRFGLKRWSQIVGVVSDVRSLSVQPESQPEVYRPYWQWPMQSPMIFVRATGDLAQLTTAIWNVTKEVMPSLPTPRVRLMTERIGESVARPRFQAQLLNLFGGVALLLAAIGIYGVLVYGVTQRRREIGIRMALGAQRAHVVRLVIVEGMRLTLLGLTLGLGVAWASARVLRSQLYEVQPNDPATFFIVIALLITVALLAAWVPARRAAHVNPMVALRCE